jgi:hypothetical protein
VYDVIVQHVPTTKYNVSENRKKQQMFQNNKNTDKHQHITRSLLKRYRVRWCRGGKYATIEIKSVLKYLLFIQ